VARVLLVGDRPVLLAGLRSLLSQQRAPAVVANADPGRRTFELTTELRPDVILIDCLASAGAFVLCHGLKQLARPQRVVLNVTHPTARLELAAWVSGADGLTGAATPAPRLAEIVCSAAAGRRVLPRPDLAAVRAAGARLEPTDLSIFGMRMYDIPLHEFSRALRLDPVEVDRRVHALVERLCLEHPPGEGEAPRSVRVAA
jgi:DNA-binding NarL/FixJ family response regulator